MLLEEFQLQLSYSAKIHFFHVPSRRIVEVQSVGTNLLTVFCCTTYCGLTAAVQVTCGAVSEMKTFVLVIQGV